MAAARVSIRPDDFDLGAEVAALRAGDAVRYLPFSELLA